MQLFEVLQALWRRRLLIAMVVIVTTVLSGLFAVSRTPEYESTSTIALTPSSFEGGFISPEALDALVGTYAQTAKAQITIEAAEEDLGEPLPGRVETHTQPGTGILEIIGVATTPQRAATTASAISKAFLGSIRPNNLLEGQVVNPATAPESPSQVGSAAIIILGFILGLIAGSLLAFFVEQLRGRIETIGDIAEVTPVPVIGTLPYARPLQRSKSRLVWKDPKLAPLREPFRALRTNIEIAYGNHRIILVTSPLAGEGKSTVIANLGVALAQVGVETLIVDADLRRPSQHSIFELDNSVGLSTALAGRNRGELPRVETAYPALTVLPSGPITGSSSELLHVRGAWLNEALRQTGALVLIDTPPILAVSDTRVLAGRADVVLLTVSAKKERPSTLRSAIDALQLSDVEIGGIVLNRSTSDLVFGSYEYSAVADEAPQRRGATPRGKGSPDAGARDTGSAR